MHKQKLAVIFLFFVIGFVTICCFWGFSEREISTHVTNRTCTVEVDLDPQFSVFHTNNFHHLLVLKQECGNHQPRPKSKLTSLFLCAKLEPAGHDSFLRLALRRQEEQAKYDDGSALTICPSHRGRRRAVNPVRGFLFAPDTLQRTP